MLFCLPRDPPSRLTIASPCPRGQRPVSRRHALSGGRLGRSPSAPGQLRCCDSPHGPRSDGRHSHEVEQLADRGCLLDVSWQVSPSTILTAGGPHADPGNCRHQPARPARQGERQDRPRCLALPLQRVSRRRWTPGERAQPPRASAVVGVGRNHGQAGSGRSGRGRRTARNHRALPGRFFESVPELHAPSRQSCARGHYAADFAVSASSSSNSSGSTGLARCRSKPASAARRSASSCP